MLSTDRIGGYMSTTIVCCNTRRYHGLMVAPSTTAAGPTSCSRRSTRPSSSTTRRSTWPAPLQGGIRAARPQVYHRLRVYADPTITYRVGGVILQKEMLWIHKRTQLMIRYTLVDATPKRTAAAAAVPRLPRQARADARQHGGRRALLPAVNGVKCRLYGLVPVALPPDQQARRGVRARARLVLRIRIPAGAGPRLRRVRRPAHDGLFRSGAQEGREHHLLGLARRNGLARPSKRFRRIHRRRTHKIDFISCLEHSARQFLIRRPATAPKWCRDTVARGFGPPDLRLAPGITLEQGHKEDCIDASTRWCARCATACSPAAPRPPSRRTPPLVLLDLQQLEREVGASRYGRATARP